MQSLLWHVTNRTAETLLIFNRFHLLLAGLAFMVLLHQRINRGVRGRPERLATIAFATLVLHLCGCKTTGACHGKDGAPVQTHTYVSGTK